MKNLKRNLLIVTLLLCLVATCFGIFTACNDELNGDEINYSVTVEYPDESGVKGVTVSFSLNGKDYGSAVTNEAGKAEKTLSAAAYDVTLSNLPEGYEFTESAKTDRKGTPLSLALTAKTLPYSVTVTLPNGATANLDGIKVVWRNGAKDVADAVTNAQGVANANLPAANYTVILSNVPEGYWLETALTASAANSAVTAVLAVDTRIEFTVSAKTEGGMSVRNVRFFVLKGVETVYESTTDKDGAASFRLLPDNYTLVTASNIAGLTPEKTSYPLSAESNSADILFTSKVVEDTVPDRKTYVLGDIMYDFTVTTYDGLKTVTLSELLESKKAVMLNFWFTTCTYCVEEFPHLAEAYEEFKDDIEVIAINPFNPSTEISNFLYQYRELFTLTFPIARDTAGLADHFIIEGYPTTVIIDKYGAVAFIEAGGILETELWMQLFTQFTADDYTQTFVPGEEISPPEEFIPDEPDVEMPSSAEIEAAINNNGCDFTYRAEVGTDDAKYSWPWVLDEKGEETVLRPSNSGYRSSYAIVHVDASLKAGEAVAFDFFSSTEATDIVYVLVENSIVWQIAGVASDWETCYAYVALTDGDYTVTLLYQKDATKNTGDDAVFIKNMRKIAATEIQNPTYIIRNCATNPNEEMTQYNSYITPVMGSDGYYRVGAANGAYVLADLLHGTNWNNVSVWQLYIEAAEEEKAFMYDLDGDGVKENCTDVVSEYLSLAMKSDSYGLVPVDAKLYALLNALTAEESENHHDREWLELCKYYSAYGGAEEYPLPTMGLREETAFTAHVGTNTYTLNRAIYPVGSLIYKFTPQKTGVYHFKSNVTDENKQTQAWLYGSTGIVNNGELAYSGDDFLATTPDDDGMNFSIYANLTQGETYYFVCAFYWGDMLGSFDFDIEYKGEYYTVVTSCASGYFTGVLDDNDNLTGESELRGVKTELYQGKYYALNEKGERESVIWIDFKQVTRANPEMSLEHIISSWICDSYYEKDAPDADEHRHHPFDFTHELMYETDENNETKTDAAGNPIVLMIDVTNYEGTDYPIAKENRLNYTEKMLKYLAKADENGYVEATEELVAILRLYTALYSIDLDNAWLQFAYYEKTYGVQPAAQPEAMLPDEQL